MDNFISPKYQMLLTKKIIAEIEKEFPTIAEASQYIKKWYIEGDGWNGNYGNFQIHTYADGEIHIGKTIPNIDGETLLKIAVDLGIETPDFIPTVATFKNDIKSDYKTAYATFEKAIKQIETHPDIAVGLANSALESIIKEILKDERITTKPQVGRTLYDLTSDLLKELQLYPGSEMPIEMKSIGSSLLSANQGIEKLRSTKTSMHGKTGDEYVIQEATYTYFIVNSVATVGLFLNSYYKNLFPKIKENSDESIELPF